MVKEGKDGPMVDQDPIVLIAPGIQRWWCILPSFQFSSLISKLDIWIWWWCLQSQI